MPSLIEPGKAYIFRIVHSENIEWIFTNGIHCRNSNTSARNYVEIGNPDLIDKRATWTVPIPPGGTLGDYVPFYFTPYSPMLYNIKTGYGGIRQRDMSEIVVLVASLTKLAASGVSFLFTDRHALLKTARFSNDLADLSMIPWTQLQVRDFKRDPDNPEKMERYQAEALVHGGLAVSGLAGILCYNASAKAKIDDLAEKYGVVISTRVSPGWYF